SAARSASCTRSKQASYRASFAGKWWCRLDTSMPTRAAMSRSEVPSGPRAANNAVASRRISPRVEGPSRSARLGLPGPRRAGRSSGVRPLFLIRHSLARIRRPRNQAPEGFMNAVTGSEAPPPGHRAPAADGADGDGTDVPRPALLRYALGSAGMGVYVTVPGLLLLYFLTDTLGVTPWLAGLALLLPKAMDIVLHPFVGSLSDRERARRGTRLRLLAAGCALAPAFVALFAVPGPVADHP